MKTYNTVLKFESEAEKQRILDLLTAEQVLFNECSTTLFSLYGYGNFVKSKPIAGQKLSPVSMVKLHHAFYRNSRELHPNWTSQLHIRAQKACLAAYKAVKSNKHRISKPVIKKNFSVQLDKRLYRWARPQGKIYLSTLADKRVVATLHSYPKLAEMFTKHELCDPHIYLNKETGDICIGVTFRTPQPTVIPKKVLGVDLGKRRLAATSDGKLIKGNEFGRHKRKIRHLKRSLQSRGTKSARRHLRKLRRKEANFSRNYTHLVANELLRTDADILVMEDLAGIKRRKHPGQNKNSVSQVPFYLLRQMLEYKALSLAKRVTLVSPYNTSRDDSRGIKRGERKGCRYYGSDGTVLDADLNAACNIRNRYLEKHPVSNPENHLVSFVPLDGGFKPDKQALVNEPTVCKSSPQAKCDKPPILIGVIDNKHTNYQNARHMDSRI